MNLDPNQVLDMFAKNVNVSGYAGPIPTSLLSRQDLEAEIVKLTNRQTPLRDIVKREKGEGRAHLWNQRTALGGLPANNNPLELFYTDGGLPTQSDPIYVQKSAAYTYIGVTGVITGPMIASGRSFGDIEAEVAETKLREVIQAEEWAMFHGDATYTNSQGQTNLVFNGLDKQVVTNVVNNAGAALTAGSTGGNTVSQLDSIIKKSRFQGGTPTHVFCSFGMQIQINQIVAPDARYIISDGSTVRAGIQANSYQSTVGVLPIVGDFFCNPATPYPYNTAGSSGPTGGPTSSIYLIQLDEMSMVDLMPVGRTELAKIADTIRFFITEYTVLAVKAEPWFGLVTNVSDPA
jgi:hypothetical protein